MIALNNIITKGSPEISQFAIDFCEGRCLQAILQLVKSPGAKIRAQALWVIGNIGNPDPDEHPFKQIVVERFEAVSKIVESFNDITSAAFPWNEKDVKKLLEQYAHTLRLLSHESTLEQFQYFKPALSVLCSILANSNSDPDAISKSLDALVDLVDGNAVMDTFISASVPQKLIHFLNEAIQNNKLGSLKSGLWLLKVIATCSNEEQGMSLTDSIPILEQVVDQDTIMVVLNGDKSTRKRKWVADRKTVETALQCLSDLCIIKSVTKNLVGRKKSSERIVKGLCAVFIDTADSSSQSVELSLSDTSIHAAIALNSIVHELFSRPEGIPSSLVKDIYILLLKLPYFFRAPPTPADAAESDNDSSGSNEQESIVLDALKNLGCLLIQYEDIGDVQEDILGEGMDCQHYYDHIANLASDDAGRTVQLEARQVIDTASNLGLITIGEEE